MTEFACWESFGANIKAIGPSETLVAPLHRHPVAEAGGAGHGAGAHPQVHQAGPFAGHGGEGAEAALLPRWEGEVVVHQLQVAAIGEHQKHPKREGALAGGGRLEVDAVAGEGAIHRKIGVPVGAAHQPVGADPLLHHRLAAAADRHQEAAGRLGGAATAGQCHAGYQADGQGSGWGG